MERWNSISPSKPVLIFRVKCSAQMCHTGKSGFSKHTNPLFTRKLIYILSVYEDPKEALKTGSKSNYKKLVMANDRTSLT